MAMLVDRGLVRYDDLVTKHWPEYGQNGKDKVTIADVMRHEGGVSVLATKGFEKDRKKDMKITASDIRQLEPMDSKMAQASFFPTEGSPRLYHAFTRGFIVDGILRRVDPKKRTLGQFIAEEIAGPLNLTLFCGIPESEQGKYKFADMRQYPDWYNLPFELLPAMCGCSKDPVLNASIAMLSDKTNPVHHPPLPWMQTCTGQLTPAFVNTKEGRAVQVSSAGIQTNARSVAKVNALMAGKGEIDGVRLMSPETAKAAMSEFVPKLDRSLGGATTSFSQGGFVEFAGTHGSMFHPDDVAPLVGLVGWGGWGGSMSLWGREEEVSIAYTMNGMGNYLLGGPRLRDISIEMKKCLAQQRAREEAPKPNGA